MTYNPKSQTNAKYDRKYIITQISKEGIGKENRVMFNGIPIDNKSQFHTNLQDVIGEQGLKVGDIVYMDSEGICHKKQYKDCEPAIVMGHHANTIYAFCAKYGDITIKPDTYTLKSDYSFTQRGDEILVRKTHNDTYEILTNKTADKLRSDFLQKQK
jgi:hypothetical protein